MAFRHRVSKAVLMDKGVRLPGLPPPPVDETPFFMAAGLETNMTDPDGDTT